MPHASDDQIRIALPRFAVKALELHAKTQAKALLVLADSPVKGMKRKSEARRQEAEEWKWVAGMCGEAMAASDHQRVAAYDVPPVALGEDDLSDLTIIPGFTDARPGTKE